MSTVEYSLDPEGKAKLTDFGIALSANLDDTQITGLMGSPIYMSPEQIKQEELTVQTDVYSLGVVMYELLTGSPPFRADNVAKLMQRILHDDPPLPTLRGNAPAAAIEILSRALARERAQRFTNAAEMADAVHDVFVEIAPGDDKISFEDKLEYIQRLDFFSDFSTEQIREILRVGGWRSRAPGEAIVMEGIIELAFYVILAGHVTVEKGGKPLMPHERGELLRGDGLSHPWTTKRHHHR